jgi:endonuclease/exonuclease/phosphatase family metal-dependent hydrolase
VLVTDIRVATFNLLHGMSPATTSAAEDALRSSARRLDADVVSLQEVDRGQDRSGRVDQAAVIAAELGAEHWRFEASVHAVPGPYGWQRPSGPALDGAGPSYGIALVSRLPVLRWEVLRFRASPVPVPLMVPGRRALVPVRDEPRLAVAAVVAVGGRELTMIGTHLSFVPGWNVAQLRRLRRWVTEQGFPAPRLLLGDLNLPGGVSSLTTGWTRLVQAPTYPSWSPRVQFDHVLADSLLPSAVRDVEVVRLAVSDHCAVIVDLTV